jgi:hypothetical protein
LDASTSTAPQEPDLDEPIEPSLILAESSGLKPTYAFKNVDARGPKLSHGRQDEAFPHRERSGCLQASAGNNCYNISD